MGYDYEDGAPSSKVCCPSNECCGYYVGNMCTDSPELDTRKFYNHCTRCLSFGTCIGDYRNAHCAKCKRHFYAGSFGRFSCPSCERKENGDDDSSSGSSDKSYDYIVDGVAYSII